VIGFVGTSLHLQLITTVTHLIPSECLSTPVWRMYTKNLWLRLSLSLNLSLMLRPTASQPVCLGIKHPSGAYDQIFVTVRQFQVCWCGALSLTRRWICRLQLLLALANAIILGSESRVTDDHISLSQIRDVPFRRLLRLAGLRWRYSIPPPRGTSLTDWNLLD
jgi:hypothetical protein